MAVSRGARSAWIVVGSVFTVMTLGFGTVQTVASLAHEERTRDADDHRAGQRHRCRGVRIGAGDRHR